jgi:hypothetical protein
MIFIYTKQGWIDIFIYIYNYSLLILLFYNIN